MAAARAASLRESDEGRASSPATKQPSTPAPKTHSTWKLLQSATIGIDQPRGVHDLDAVARPIAQTQTAIPRNETR